MKASEIRAKWLEFFESKGHHIEPSASLVPHNDPSLLWINAGMAPLKPYFDGRVKPDNPRIANSQKCIRTNDIENVGKTRRHHTFFEMLGNFSIGDYFKEEAITWAWEFLTDKRWIGFDPSRLYVTVYNEDEEAYKLWNEKIGLPADHIIKTGDDNFWDIGEGLAVLARRFSTIAARNTARWRTIRNAIQAARTSAIWKYGTSYSRNSITIRTAATLRCPTKISIPAQGSSGSLPSCRMSIRTSIPTCSSRLFRLPPALPALLTRTMRSMTLR